MPTHEVLNQPPPLEDYDLFLTDPVLPDAVAREGGKWALDALSELGSRAGSSEGYRWGFEANTHPPVLRTHDRFGHRIDQVEFHPAWHSLLGLSVSSGLHSLPWEHPPASGARVVRDAMFMLVSQVEAGHGCPISMTASAVPVLRRRPDLAAMWEPSLLSRAYDPRPLPRPEKTGALMGMGMTEKQGGSDVRRNTTTASPVGDGEYRLTGHKWFTSAPTSDAFLVLAQAPGGLSCFLLPRFTPDGELNPFYIQRLKDKLGNRSNASAEVEFEGTAAWLVGEEGRGIPTIIDMVNGTRLDCVIGAVGLMRQAVAQAAWHVAHRRAFGALLIDQPLMQNVIADLEVEVEAATLMMVRLSAAFDRAAADPAEAAFQRLATPVAKYWVTKRCTEVVREAMECLGGNGYVEESILPRLFRESPLNAIWEGSGNVIVLDALRAIATTPDALAAFLDEVRAVRGANRVLDSHLDDLPGGEPEVGGRRLVERLALAWAGSLLVRHGDPGVAEAYCRTRPGGDHGSLFGTLPTGTRIDDIARRAVPLR